MRRLGVSLKLEYLERDVAEARSTAGIGVDQALVKSWKKKGFKRFFDYIARISNKEECEKKKEKGLIEGQGFDIIF